MHDISTPQSQPQNTTNPLVHMSWPGAAGVGDQYFRRAFDHAVVGMAVVALDGRWMQVNPSLCGILGYTESELLGFTFQQMTHPDDLESDLSALRQLLEGDIFSQQMERRYLHKRGHAVWIQLSISLVRNAEDDPQYFIFQVQDISDRKRAADQLQQAHEELKARVRELEQRTAELSLVSETGELLQSCRGVDEAYKIIGRSIRQLFPTESGALCVLNAGRDHVEATISWGDEVHTDSYFTPDDCWALRRNRMHVVLDAEADLACPHVHGNHPGYMCLPLTAQRETLGLLYVHTPSGQVLTTDRQQLARTVAEQISLALSNLQLQETLRRQSVRDPLTGLFNRRYLEESLEREISRSRRNGQPLGLIMLDIDHFKRINDTHGHDGGDEVLRHVATLLVQSLRKADVACRYGGEEFTLILPEATLHDALQKAEQIREATAQLQILYQHGHIPVTLSLGVSGLHDEVADSSGLLAAADAALYRAKQDGRNRVVSASTLPV